MIYIVDTANTEAIAHCNEYYPIAGVTTNPSIIAKENTNFSTLLKKIRQIIGPDKMLHVQATSEKAEYIVKEAEAIEHLVGGNFYIKVPITAEGLKAMMQLKRRGFQITATACFTQQQALIAAEAGADFVAPYVNRLDNIGTDGSQVVAEIVELFRIHGLKTKVLSASFKNVEQVHRVLMAGSQAVTVNPDVLERLIYRPLTDAAIATFESDWRSVYGDKTVIDLLSDPS